MGLMNVTVPLLDTISCLSNRRKRPNLNWDGAIENQHNKKKVECPGAHRRQLQKSGGAKQT